MKKRSHEHRILSADEGAQLAFALGIVPDGDFRLTGTVRLWRRKDGHWTGRFVYRSSGPTVSTLVHTIRGLSLS